MKTDRNDFQRLVDQQLGNICWDQARSAKVLRSLRPAPSRARLPRFALTFAMLLIAVYVITSSVLHRAPVPDTAVATRPAAATPAPLMQPDTRAEAVFLARRTVMEQYGLTLDTLGIFLDDCRLTETGWVVTFQTNGQINRRLAGVYTVEKQNGFITAGWSHDEVDPALWADGTLNRIAWGQKQLRYARGEGAREAMAINQELNALEGTRIDYSYIEGYELWGDPLTDAEPDPGDLPVQDAVLAAQQALARQFSLTWEQLSALENPPLIYPEAASLLVSESGVRVWRFTPSMQLEGVTYHLAVCINAATGEVERLEYTTLGNG